MHLENFKRFAGGSEVGVAKIRVQFVFGAVVTAAIEAIAAAAATPNWTGLLLLVVLLDEVLDHFRQAD